MDKRLGFIDALRGYAIFGVILVHASIAMSGMPQWLVPFASQGAKGVQLFYIVSAYTLFLSLQSKINEPRPTMSFFIRRFFRIAPLFYISIILFLVIDSTNRINSTWNIITHVLFINSISPYYINTLVIGGWSIAIEMTFYLFVPFMFKRIKTLKAAVNLFLFSLFACMGLICLLLKFQLIRDTTLWHAYLFMWLPSQFPIFSIGFILYYLPKELPIKIDKRLFSYILASVSVILILGLVFAAKLVNQALLIYPFGITFLIFAYSLSIYQSTVFVNSFWVYLGKVSYSIYLLHYPILSFGNYLVSCLSKRLIMPESIKFAFSLSIAFLLCLLIASITYRFIEKPGIVIGKKLISAAHNRNCVKKIFDN